jgi:hypothetical protein
MVAGGADDHSSLHVENLSIFVAATLAGAWNDKDGCPICTVEGCMCRFTGIERSHPLELKDDGTLFVIDWQLASVSSNSVQWRRGDDIVEWHCAMVNSAVHNLEPSQKQNVCQLLSGTVDTDAPRMDNEGYTAPAHFTEGVSPEFIERTDAYPRVQCVEEQKASKTDELLCASVDDLGATDTDVAKLDFGHTSASRPHNYLQKNAEPKIVIVKDMSDDTDQAGSCLQGVFTKCKILVTSLCEKSSLRLSSELKVAW